MFPDIQLRGVIECICLQVSFRRADIKANISHADAKAQTGNDLRFCQLNSRRHKPGNDMGSTDTRRGVSTELSRSPPAVSFIRTFHH